MCELCVVWYYIAFKCYSIPVYAGLLQSELTDVIDLKDADNVSESQRRVLRLADEDDKFDDDHYL